MRIKRYIKETIKDINRFVLIVVGIMLTMLPIIASVFGGIVLADWLSGWDDEVLAIVFFMMIIMIAFLSFINIKKKLSIKK